MADPAIADLRDVFAAIRADRNQLTRDALRELRKQQPGSFSKMTLRLGGRTFKNFRDADLDLVKTTFQPFSVIDTANPGNALEAALFAYELAKMQAAKRRRTGKHFESIRLYLRNVGDAVDREVRPETLRANPRLPERPVFTILAETAYANKLETLRDSGRAIGIIFFAKTRTVRQFGRVVSVKFDYLSGRRIGLRGGTFPRLQIGNPGDVRGSSRRPKATRRR